jgi:outer membrane receptor protein involved in Fe transport
MGKHLLALSLASIMSGVAHATVLDEIVVTAQKREQNLQDVPMAILAVKGEDMRATGIEKLEGLAPTVPSLHVSEAFGGDQIFLRGLGPGVNFGFEQAVGQVVDGYFYGRSRFSRLQFLDLERVEILKGPQGAIIGKNTTAGAINITTAKPTKDFEAWATAGYEFEGSEGYNIEGAISGPVTETLSVRFALRYENKDGFLKNAAAGGRKDQGRDDLATRLSLSYDPTDNFNVLLQWGHADIKRVGRTIQTIHCSDTYRVVVPEEDCQLDDRRYVADIRAGEPGFEFQDTEADTFGVTLTWDLENFTITSLTGYAEYDYLDAGVASYSDIESFMIDIAEDYEQTTQEFRIASSWERDIDFIAGAYYQDHKLKSDFDLNILNLGPNTFNRNRHIETDQEGDLWAVFGQLVYHLNDQFDVTFEGRYTHEEKSARSLQFPTEVYSHVPVAGPGSGGPAGLFNVHDVSGDITHKNFSPGLVLAWRPDDDAMYYASVKKGFKGGGFDHQLTANQAAASDGRFSFDEEDVLSFELGGKFTFADGAARLNISIYRNEYDDLQVSALSGPVTFTVGNAASAVTQGVDADLQWQATEALFIQASVSLLDAKYDDFQGAACSYFQTSNGLCPNGVQDLSGKTLPYAPNYSYNVSATYVWPLADGLEISGMLRAYGEDDKALAQDLDPLDYQKSYIKLDARLALAKETGQWELALIGRNLTNETTVGFANDITFFAGSHYGMTEAPRSVALQGTIRF